MKLYFTFLISLFIFCKPLAAQNSKESNNPIEQDEFSDGGEEDKSALKKMISDRSYPDFNTNAMGRYPDEMKAYHAKMKQTLTANWAYIDASGGINGEVGRATSVAFDTINPGRFYVCSNNSGVWLTNNNGLSYTPITESLPTQSTSCLVIDPTNTDVLYLATGTHNGDMVKNSLGVFKSTDGGLTWNATGLSFPAANAISIGDLICNPLNPVSLLAATTDGLYRTFDGGLSWTKILNDNVVSVCFKPGDTTIIHVTGLNYYRSVNSGNTFTVSTGYFNAFTYNYDHYVRTTAADPSILYLISNGLTLNPSNPRFYIYKSSDDGLTFTLYDSLAGEYVSQCNVSQLHPDKFIAGYRNTFKKENASGSFQLMTTWTSASASNYLHSDQRGLFFDPLNDSIIYSCNDGGLCRSTDNGLTFQSITNNMVLTHLYTFSNSATTNYKILVSTLDVQPYIIGSTGISQAFPLFVESWSSRMNKLNDSKYFISHQTPYFTTNNGASFYQSTHPLISWVYWPHNFQFDYCDENTSYFGSFDQLFKSTDNCLTYHDFLKTTDYSTQQQGFEVCRANPNYIYVYYADSVLITTTGVSAFTNITAGLPVSSAIISHLAVDPADEKKVWVAFSGYSAGNKIFYSFDAGQTWSNVSAGLPNVPINYIVCQKGVPGAIYAGTDGGVFYKDNTFSNWQYYNTGLPNVIVTALDVQYPLGKLRCSTFGRGVWETDFYQPTPSTYILPPATMFSTANINACVGQTVLLNNTTCGVVDSVLWLFPGGIPATSTSTNSTVIYASPGNYTVSLIAYNSSGADTLTLTGYIHVAAATPLPYIEPVTYIAGSIVLPAPLYATEVNFDNFSWLRTQWNTTPLGINWDGCVYYPNYDFNLNGLTESLIFPTFDFTGSAHPKFYFNRAYQQRSATENDTLKIIARTCGGSDSLLWVKGGAQLANIGGFNSAMVFQPNQPSDWVRDSVDLTAFAGLPNVIVEFANTGYGGQALYLDEFKVENVSTTAGIVNDDNFSAVFIYPNPTHHLVNVSGIKLNLKSCKILNVLGESQFLNSTLNTNSITIDLSHFPKGIYFLQITDHRGSRINRKLVVD